MIRTQIYYPENPVKFRRNLQRRWHEFSERVAHYNSEESMSTRTDRVSIYHVLDTTVFINAPSNDRGRVNITANISSIPEKIEPAKSLLEKITNLTFVKDGTTFSVSMTFGVSEYNSLISVDTTIDQADKALYYGKHHGKGCVVTFSSLTDDE